MQDAYEVANYHGIEHIQSATRVTSDHHCRFMQFVWLLYLWNQSVAEQAITF